MRIGELAALAGVSTRAVRHYHRIGLLPEPARRANGYRAYGLRDAAVLVRVRRLTELGLSLDEVRDVLADEAGRDLRDILTELDADLARQEEAVRQRRARLAELLAQAADGEGIPAEGPVSPELTEVFRRMARTSARLPGPEPEMAARERELLALLEGSAQAAETHGWLTGMLQALGSDPDAMRRAYDVYARLDELAEADVDDERIDAVARAVVDAVPEEVAATMGRGVREATRSADDDAFADALFADFAPAQAEAVRRAMRLMQERAG
ncbi:MerR family transcriptional regulator [Streptomyces sp. DSM 42041]|uniref:MerR family transcriptional regulator n=1 Tax=Streptomyces hazeniae TaxID=3075538 RepID=A0ABU2NXN7_9ACTN|nr:MerR family transcriptional regulator [Streptomyces sp. DSM 42041]MDT0381755.1 MerR family transcriptional regulator [Streptomyces sp. DSM 42041]